MKNRIFTLVLVAVMCVSLMTSCFIFDGKTTNELTAEEAAAKIAGFTTNPTTVSGTWVQDFKLEVNSDNQSFKAFEQDIKATVEFQLDLTAGNLYYYAKRTTDAGESHEEIVVKSEGKYFYKSTTLNPVELADEAAALAKIGECFKAITTEKAGWLDLDAFLFDSEWVSAYVMLGSTNVPTTEGRNFAYKYEKTEGDGLSIALDAKYVGYTGDSGIVDVGTNDTCTGSAITLETTKDGHITSFSQSVNNYIEFNITNPPIPLVYTGTRTLTASYGAVTAKTLADVAMTATTGTVEVNKGANVMKVEVFGFTPPATVNPASNGVEAGNYIALKITFGAGFEADSVKINGVEATNMNGFYCHMVPVEAGGLYTVEASAKQTAEGPVNTKANVTVEAADGITYELYDFKYDGMVFTPTEGEVEQGNFIAVKITSEGEFAVKVDGNDATFINGYYCYMSSVAAGTTYALTIAPAEQQGGEDLTGPATVTVNAPDGVTYEVYDYAQAPVLSSDNTVEAGHYIAIKITSEGEYVVKVDGNATTVIQGFHCYMTPVAAGTSYTVTIAEVAPAGNVTVQAADGITYELYDFDLANFGFTPTENNVAVDHYIAVKITSGNATVTVNGNATAPQGAYLCYMTAVAEGESYTVVITAAE